MCRRSVFLASRSRFCGEVELTFVPSQVAPAPSKTGRAFSSKSVTVRLVSQSVRSIAYLHPSAGAAARGGWDGSAGPSGACVELALH
jgi:hypothetical protein